MFVNYKIPLCLKENFRLLAYKKFKFLIYSEVNLFFDNLLSLMEKDKFTPSQIFKTDKTCKQF